MTPRVLVVGSINMDLVIRAPRFPQPGETVIGEEFGTFPGGKGANQAVAARKLGAEVRMIGKVGNDSFGLKLREGLAQEGVDVSGVSISDNQSTGVALIVVDQSGQNSIVVSSGANMSLSPEDLGEHEGDFSWARVVLFQLESPLETVLEGIKLAREKGAYVILNPAPARSLPQEIWKEVDLLVPNETEAAILANNSLQSLDPERAAREFIRKGVKEVIVSLGEKGCLYASSQKVISHPAFNVQAVDSTAAGDAFVGALSVGMALGWKMEKSIAFASASGALAVTKKGAQSSLPYRKEVEEFLRVRGVF
ncbi:MAG: ribokinase [Coprothermobacterota bacterium]|nr:ribokinase [Coprothermobacterota bacterium]